MSGLSCIIMYTLYSLELCFTKLNKGFYISYQPFVRETLLPILAFNSWVVTNTWRRATHLLWKWKGVVRSLCVSSEIEGWCQNPKKNLCSIWHSKTKNKNVLFVDCHSALDPVRSYLIWISDAQNQSIIRWPWCQSCTQRTFHFLLQYPNRQQICLF